MATKGTAHHGNNLITGQAPELLDKLFMEINDNIIAELGWLDNAFGRAERLVKFDSRDRRIYTPCWYYHDNNYVELTPTDQLGNFSFFWVDDPQETEGDPHRNIAIMGEASFIIWFDFRKVFNGYNRNREQVKADILKAFNDMTLRHGHFTVRRVYELAENIYDGFSLEETDNQFLMSPYGGFRLTGDVLIHANCTDI